MLLTVEVNPSLYEICVYMNCSFAKPDVITDTSSTKDVTNLFMIKSINHHFV